MLRVKALVGFLVGATVSGRCWAFLLPAPQKRPSPAAKVANRRGGTFRPCSGRQGLLHLAGTAASTVSSNGELLPGIEAIDAMNPELLAKLESLREQPYFRLYSVDMLASCEYMPQELFECYSETCEVYPVDDEAVCRSFDGSCAVVLV